MSTFTYPIDIVVDNDVSSYMDLVRCSPYGDLALFIVQQNHILEQMNHFPTRDTTRYGIGSSQKISYQSDYDNEVKLESKVGVTFSNPLNPFWLLPEPPMCPNTDFTMVKSKRYETSSKVIKGQFFNDKQELQLNVRLKCVEEGYEFDVSQSNKCRWEAKCHQEGCKWRIRATKLDNSSVFQVKTLIDVHTCSKTQTNPHHRNANRKCVGHILQRKMTDSGRVYRGKEIKTDMNLEYGIDISYPQAWRGKCYALELIRGSVEESFTKLPLYCHNLKKANPGTVTHIKTDDMERFQFFFVAIGASIRSFLNCLRPLLIIDGAHLKGKYLGTMFLAVGMDGNNQIVPIAFGVGKTESGESWSWFMTKLKECIGEQPGLAIISDRANSIDSALRQVFPHAYHGLCCRHLMVNIKLNTKQKQKYQDLYWKTCKSYTVSEFELWKARLEAAVPSVTQTLQQAGYEKWARAHYPGNRYNIMTSNSAECSTKMWKSLVPYVRTPSICVPCIQVFY